MKLKFVIATALLSVVTVHADITLVQDTLLNGVASRTTMWVKGPLVRTDNDTTTSVIIDTKSGDMTTLMHEQKMLVKMNTKQLQQMAVTTSAAPAEDVTKITATGEKETVDGYDCEIYFSELKGMKVKMWVARNYPNYDKLSDELKVMNSIASPSASKQPDVPGMAIKTEYEQQGLKFTTKLISLTTGSVDADRFSVPADYKAP